MIQNPFIFIQQVRAEVKKVTWPTRKETITTTIMAFIMVMLSVVFFFCVDQLLNVLVSFLLNLG